MTQSAKLTEFYQSYAKWLDEGAPDHKPFSRRFGLCTSFDDFMRDSYGAIDQACIAELYEQFVAAGLSGNYPFDTHMAYGEARHLARQHRNPKRIQWVREHIA
jgi:hypothetical protein